MQISSKSVFPSVKPPGWMQCELCGKFFQKSFPLADMKTLDVGGIDHRRWRLIYESSDSAALICEMRDATLQL